MPAKTIHPAATQNRRIRVFVSSTFRDMMGERDELMTHTWPELHRFCRERQVELVEVDLRWGIAEEQSTRKETLKLCLDEIRACRPFFIGLLGERYGSPYLPVCQVSDSESCTMQNDRLSYPACISNDRLNSR